MRNATTLSVILNIPVEVKNIRAGRSQDGLRAQHLTSIQLLKEFSQAEVNHANLGTTEIQFQPNTIKGGQYLGDTKTAGSVCLMMQTALPCLIFADKPSTLRLLGGTNVDFSPDIDYYETIFRPIAQRFNFTFELDIVRRGYYPKGGGDVRVTINPIDQLTSIDLTDFGEIKRFFGRSFVAGNLSKDIADEIAEAAIETIRQHYSDKKISIEIERIKEPDHMTIGNASGIMIGVETTTGCLLAANGLGKRDKTSINVGRQTAEELIKDLSYKACVDRHLEDQLILLMALAKGHSKVRCGPLSDRTKTAIFVVEQLTNVKFLLTQDQSSESQLNNNTIIECDGLGYRRHF